MHSTDGIDLSDAISRVASGFLMRSDQRIDDSVAAVIPCGADTRYMPATLAAVLSQSVLPGALIVVDCSRHGYAVVPSRMVLADVEGHGSGDVVGDAAPGDVSRRGVSVVVVGAPRARSFAQAVSEAMPGLGLAGDSGRVRFLWLLHDDSRPMGRRCLECLLEVKSNTPSADVVGVKQLDWDGDGLHDVGRYAYGHGLVSLVVDGEPDQQQYDDRRDVFAVSLAGALIPLATIEKYGGIDSWFGTFAEGDDLCRRICRSGGRVVVVPMAAVAHRRARYEGVRTRDGRAVDEMGPLDPLPERLRAERRYRYTDVAMHRWPFLWIADVLMSVLGAMVSLLRKSPYEAWTRLSLPWRGWGDAPRAVRARRRVSAQSTVAMSRLRMLRATRRQIRQWRSRDRARLSDGATLALNPLVRAHLHRRAIIRSTCAVAMAFLAFLSIVIVRWDVFRGALAGGSLMSSQLPPTAADLGMVIDAADNWWYLGNAAGTAVPSTPWMWVWGGASVLTGGNVVAALSFLFFASAPVCALSMWALAGVFTRSDTLRVAAGLAWVSVGVLMGLYQTANLPMLTVMMFLPVAFAFVFRAVGMYHTEDPRIPRASVQAAACAALAFMPAVAAEPQLVLGLLLVLVSFMPLVRRHRIMLLMIPIPSVAIVAPNVVHALATVTSGGVRQLFGDVMVSGVGINGSPAAMGLIGVLDRAFGLRLATLIASREDLTMMLTVVSAVMLAVTAVVACLSLFLPFVLRVSRMMWMVMVVGLLLSLASSRIAVSTSSQGSVAGSVLPGIALVMLGLLSCLCMVAGGAVRRFSPLPLSAQSEKRPDSHGAVRASMSRVARVALAVVLAGSCAAWFMSGLARDMGRGVSTTVDGLPIIASDYLGKDPTHRILAMSAQNLSRVDTSLMRTQRGDLVDSSPAMAAAELSSTVGHASNLLSSSAARLVAGTDDDAIRDIASLGIGGIYVVADSDDTTASKATERLVTNITSSDGVEVVVSDASGVYYRITTPLGSTVKDSVGRSEQSRADPWRRLWLVVMGVVTGLYCCVAIPLSFRLRKETA